MSDSNPYAAPDPHLPPPPPPPQEGDLSINVGIVTELRSIRSSTRAIVFFGITILLGAIGIVTYLSFATHDMSSDGYRANGGLIGELFSRSSFLDLLLILLPVIGVVLLSRFNGAVSKLVESGEEPELQLALRRQKTFWIFAAWFLIASTVIGLIEAFPR